MARMLSGLKKIRQDKGNNRPILSPYTTGGQLMTRSGVSLLLLCYNQHFEVLCGKPVLSGESSESCPEYIDGMKPKGFQQPGYFAGDIVPLADNNLVLVSVIVGEYEKITASHGHKVKILVRSIKTGMKQAVQAVQSSKDEFARSLQGLRNILQNLEVHLIGFH